MRSYRGRSGSCISESGSEEDEGGNPLLWVGVAAIFVVMLCVLGISYMVYKRRIKSIRQNTDTVGASNTTVASDASEVSKAPEPEVPKGGEPSVRASVREKPTPVEPVKGVSETDTQPLTAETNEPAKKDSVMSGNCRYSLPSCDFVANM